MALFLPACEGAQREGVVVAVGGGSIVIPLLTCWKTPIMSEGIPVVPLPPAVAHKKKPSGGLLPFASLLCCAHSSDQRPQ